MSTAPIRLPFALTRGFLRRVAAALAGVLLCAQLAVAAYACPALFSPAVVQPEAADASVEPGAMPMPHCDGVQDAPGATLDPAAPNLCAEHCKYGQQSDNPATLSVPTVLMTALYAVQPVPVAAPPARAAATALSALVAASPPHAIAHCVYRI